MTFGDATAIEGEDGRYSAEVQDGWGLAGVTNGGYLMAMAGRAMAAETRGRHLVSITGHFMNPANPGAVSIEVEQLKSGSRYTTARATMSAGTKILLSVTGSLAEPSSIATDAAVVRGSPPDLPPPEECQRAESSENSLFPPPLVDRIDMRLHPADAAALAGEPSGVAEMRGWWRLLDDESIDPFAIVLAVDSFPPAVFNMNLPMSWTPTLDLTVHVRDPGPHVWLMCRTQTRFVTGGFLEEDAEVWDDQGNLVALSRQLALVGRG